MSNPFTSSEVYDQMKQLDAAVEPLREGVEKSRQEKKAEEERIKNVQETVREGLARIIEQLPEHENVVVPREDGAYLLVRKSDTAVRLARSDDPDIRMGGYEPDFSKMSGYEEVLIRRGIPSIVNVYKPEMYRNGEHRYAKQAQRIHLADIPHGELVAATHTVDDLPEIAPLTASLPSVAEFFRREVKKRSWRCP